VGRNYYIAHQKLKRYQIDCSFQSAFVPGCCCLCNFSCSNHIAYTAATEHCFYWLGKLLYKALGHLPGRIIIVIKQAFLVRKWRRRYRITDFETLSLHWDPSVCDGQAFLCSHRNLQWNTSLMGHLFSERWAGTFLWALRGIQLLYLLSTDIAANIVAALLSHDILKITVPHITTILDLWRLYFYSLFSTEFIYLQNL